MSIDDEIAEAEQWLNVAETKRDKFARRAAAHRKSLDSLRARKAAESRTVGQRMAEKMIIERRFGGGYSVEFRSLNGACLSILGDCSQTTVPLLREAFAAAFDKALAGEREQIANEEERDGYGWTAARIRARK